MSFQYNLRSKPGGLWCSHWLPSKLHCQVRWPRELNALKIEKNTCKLRKQLSSIWQHTRLQMLTTQPKKNRAAKQMYLVVLWAFAVCFFMCLCCEDLHHLRSNWRWFLDFFYLHVFSEAAARWALSATVVKAQKSMKDIVCAFSAGWYSPKWRYGDATVPN